MAFKSAASMTLSIPPLFEIRARLTAFSSYIERQLEKFARPKVDCNEAWSQGAVFRFEGRMADILDHGVSDEHVSLFPVLTDVIYRWLVLLI